MTVQPQIDTQLLAAFRQQAWPQVLQRATQLLPLTPADANLHFFAGIAQLESGQLPQAHEHFAEAVRLKPERPDYATQLARSLAMARRMREALDAADRAMKLQFDHPSMPDTLGVVYTQANAHERATAAFRVAAKMAPNHPPFRFNLGYSLIAVGDVEGAERELEATVALDPRHFRAHLILAQLRKQTPEKNHLERLRRLIAQHGNLGYAQIYLNIALAKEYEDTADFPRAYEHLVSGKSAMRRARPYSIKRDEEMFENVQRMFPAPQTGPSTGDSTDEPIFVMGMPRSGTTLLDRILSSHPDVYSAGELQHFPVAIQNASGSEAPVLMNADMAARIDSIDWQALGSTYLASTRPATGEQPRFIDKMPHNFLYAGFIARALPNAKLICLRRDPMDTCLSNFRHLFEQESSFYDYSCDLLDTGKYFIMFDRLMAHWRRVLPGRILEVDYEALVQAQEATTRQLLEFCGLPWNEACIHFEKNAAHVSTPHAWQVRSPIYRTALKHWKNYEPQVGALVALLRDAGVTFAE